MTTLEAGKRRGETDTPGKVRGQVEQDLVFTDPWSLLFDRAILDQRRAGRT